MAYEFRLPDIGEGLTEAEVVQWFVQVGEEVELDQPLVQIETDKAVTEVPAPRAGVLLHQGAPAGARVEVGQVLAVIGERGEVWAGPEARAGERAAEAEGGAGERAAEAQARAGEAAAAESVALVGTLPEAPEAAEVVPEPPAPPRPEALPAVRRLARELGVDLATVRGTGPQGRITRADVERAARAASATAAARAVPAQAAPEERVRLSKLRRTIAERLSRSWREIPHVTTFGQADAGRLLHAQRALATRRGERLPLETLFVRAVLPALQAHPQFNAAVEGEDLVLKRHYDIGIAVDTPEGLVVPVVRNADRLDLWALAREVARLIEAARNRTATPEELTGPTFTISNIGAVGGSYGTPLIPWGTTAILSFGRVEEQAVVRGGRVEVAAMLPLSLSYDHRAIDGALGRRFLATVIEHLEEPALLVG
ncbi:MAG TPA: dihydrolipoamide acetyltransferase family protein [Actinomycetota bacterium]|nr:dihydrolipoamide acetyltransferase family protein [Actinomycetota bacterium]